MLRDRDLYVGFEPSQLSCLGSLVGESVTWRADSYGFEFESHLRQPIFLRKNDCFGRVVLFCFAFLLCLPFSASLGVIVHVDEYWWFSRQHVDYGVLLRKRSIVFKPCLHGGKGSASKFFNYTPPDRADLRHCLYLICYIWFVYSYRFYRTKCEEESAKRRGSKEDYQEEARENC